MKGQWHTSGTIATRCVDELSHGAALSYAWLHECAHPSSLVFAWMRRDVPLSYVLSSRGHTRWAWSTRAYQCGWRRAIRMSQRLSTQRPYQPHGIDCQQEVDRWRAASVTLASPVTQAEPNRRICTRSTLHTDTAEPPTTSAYKSENRTATAEHNRCAAPVPRCIVFAHCFVMQHRCTRRRHAWFRSSYAAS